MHSQLGARTHARTRTHIYMHIKVMHGSGHPKHTCTHAQFVVMHDSGHPKHTCTRAQFVLMHGSGHPKHTCTRAQFVVMHGLGHPFTCALTGMKHNVLCTCTTAYTQHAQLLQCMNALHPAACLNMKAHSRHAAYLRFDTTLSLQSTPH